MFHKEFTERGFNTLSVTVDDVAHGDGNSLPTNVKFGFALRSHLTVVVGDGVGPQRHDEVTYVELRITGEDERRQLVAAFRRIADILTEQGDDQQV